MLNDAKISVLNSLLIFQTLYDALQYYIYIQRYLLKKCMYVGFYNILQNNREHFRFYNIYTQEINYIQVIW